MPQSPTHSNAPELSQNPASGSTPTCRGEAAGVRFAGRLVLAALAPAELRARNASAQLWMLAGEFAVLSQNFGRVVVPAGFVGDLASVPRWALPYLDDDAPEILYGSIVHDWIYSRQGELPGRRLTRAEADELLRLCMLACGARPAQARLVWLAVRLGGGGHWKAGA